MSAPGLRPAPPCAFVIFGAAGDLTKRKLLPALYNLKAAGLLPPQLAIVGVARKEKSHEQFREEQSKDIREFATQPVDEALWVDVRSALYYQAGEFSNPETYTKLKTLLDEAAKTHHTMGNALFYLATPPEFFGEIVKRLGEAGLVQRGQAGWRRVVIEKPFGRDLDSARELNTELGRVLDESQIYRIDHYLGKETVQNIMVFRFANGLFEPVWNRRYVDHVQIMVAETVGVEDRGNYYDKAGVVRDMVQNHMFQLMALVAMEPPTSFEANAVRDERVKVLKAIRSWKPEDVLGRAVRGQYGPGEVNGQPVPGYRGEAKVNPNSNTETYAALRLQVENWRWAPARHRDHDPVPATPALAVRRKRRAGRSQSARAPHPARRGHRDSHQGQASGAGHGAQHRQARFQLQAVRRDERGHGLRAAALRQHGGRLHALPPGRHGRGGLAHRHAHRGCVGVPTRPRLPQLCRGLLGPSGRRHAHSARRPLLVAASLRSARSQVA